MKVVALSDKWEFSYNNLLFKWTVGVGYDVNFQPLTVYLSSDISSGDVDYHVIPNAMMKEVFDIDLSAQTFQN